MDENRIITFTAKDNLSKSVGNMQNAIQHLTQDILNYQKTQTKIFNKKIELKYDFSSAKNELTSFTKEVNAAMNSNQKNFESQHKNIQQLEKDYMNLAKVVKEASNAEKNLGESAVKDSNSSNKADEKSNFKKAMIEKDLLKMVGTSMANAAGAYATSFLGDRDGNTISSILSGALSGAAIGSTVSLGAGTIVGGIMGLISGIFDAVGKEIKSKDDFVKNEVKTLYTSLKQEETNSLNNGNNIAKKNELNKVSVAHLFGGKEDEAKKFIDKVIRNASTNSLNPDDAVKIGKTLLNSKYKENEIIPFLNRLANTSASLGLTSDETISIANVFANIRESNKVSAEDLKILDKLKLGATDLLANRFNVNKEGLSKMISSGSVDREKAESYLADNMDKKYSDGTSRYSKTYEGTTSNLKEKQDILDSAMGEGYEEERKKTIQASDALLDSSIGDTEKQIYKLMGTCKADLENERENIIRNNLFHLINDDENFRKAKEQNNGAEMIRMFSEVKANGEMEFKNSPKYQQYLQNETNLIGSIQKDVGISDGYIKYGMMMADKFTEGYMKVMNDRRQQGVFNFTLDPETNNYGIGNKYINKAFIQQSDSNNKENKVSAITEAVSIVGGVQVGKNNAIGLDRVPYDNYPAILHEGERVLTRVQADQQQSSSVSPVINMYNTVRDDSDIDKIVTALVTQLSKVQGSFGGEY